MPPAPVVFNPLCPYTRRIHGLFLISNLFLTALLICLAFAVIHWLRHPSGTAVFPPCTDSREGWYGTGLFGINVARGNLSFFWAKAIDASWNMGAGRGSQVVATLICCKVFGMALLRITEKQKVSLEFYAAISFFPTDLKTAWTIVKERHIKGWRTTAIIAWVTVASIYVLAVPTLLDLLTGYISKEVAMVKLPTGDWTPYLSGSCGTNNSQNGDGPVQSLNSTSSPSNCTFLSFEGYHFPPSDLIDRKKNWNISYSGPIICVPTGQYQWGFSIGWALAFVVLTSFWTWGIYGLWVDSLNASKIYHSGRHPGFFRNIIDIGNALQGQLETDTSNDGESDLANKIESLDPVAMEVTGVNESLRIRLSKSGPDIKENLWV